MKTDCMLLSWLLTIFVMLHISCIFINPSAVLGLSCLLRVFRFHTIVKLLVIPIGIWNFRSSALSLPGAKSPQMELSFPWNFRSLEHSLPWSKKSKNFRSMELSLSYLKEWGKALQQSVCIGVFWQW